MRRYVPKTYYNRRFLRMIIRSVVSVVVAVFLIFIILFFVIGNSITETEDGSWSLDIPWLVDEQTPPED